MPSAQSDADVVACGPAMHQLRPHLPGVQLLARIRYRERGDYRRATAPLGDEVIAVAGFRTGLNLARSRFLHTSDLVAPAIRRARGQGGALVEWLSGSAWDDGCSQLPLDSGPQRTDAHHFVNDVAVDATRCHFAYFQRSTGA